MDTDAKRKHGHKYAKCLAYNNNCQSEEMTNAGYSVVIIW